MPDQSSPGSTRATLGVTAAGHPSKNELKNPAFVAEQPEKRNTELLEEQLQREWIKAENKDFMRCFYNTRSSECRFAKWMHELWFKKFPRSVITK